MAYKLIYTRSAYKDIKKLDPTAKKKIKKKIEVYSKNPHQYSRKLIKLSIGTYRWRAGNYRIIFDIKAKDIIVLRVGHRREIYK